MDIKHLVEQKQNRIFREFVSWRLYLMDEICRWFANEIRFGYPYTSKRRSEIIWTLFTWLHLENNFLHFTAY